MVRPKVIGSSGLYPGATLVRAILAPTWGELPNFLSGAHTSAPLARNTGTRRGLQLPEVATWLLPKDSIPTLKLPTLVL